MAPPSARLRADWFSIQSARYAEKHRRYRGVDFAVFYHPRHEWNVDRMLDAMEGSLDYYLAIYPHRARTVRLLHDSGLGTYAFPSVYFVGRKM